MPQTYPLSRVLRPGRLARHRSLTVNFGLRYEFTLPPVAGDDQYEDFSPTTPNPAVNNYPGALIFAGNGAGRAGQAQSGARAGTAAWSRAWAWPIRLNSKTTIRGRLRALLQPGDGGGQQQPLFRLHRAVRFASTNQGITPAFNWDQGLPSYPLPPQIDPAFANNTNTDYWQGQDATRAPESYNWTLLDSARLTPNTVLEANYNAMSGRTCRPAW